jgi:hypothetical protein
MVNFWRIAISTNFKSKTTYLNFLAKNISEFIALVPATGFFVDCKGGGFPLGPDSEMCGDMFFKCVFPMLYTYSAVV